MAHFTKLPVELLLNLMCNLVSVDLLSVAQTAKKFQEPALECLYRHPQLNCRGRDDHNKSTRRWDPIVTLALRLLQEPHLAKRVRSLDMNLTPHDYMSPLETFFPGQGCVRSAADKTTSHLLRKLLDRYTNFANNGFWEEECKDCVRRGEGFFWTYILLMLTSNLENLWLGPHYYQRRFFDLAKSWVRLGELPGLRAVKNLRIDRSSVLYRLNWEWMTLPSLRSFSHPEILDDLEYWPRELIAGMESLHTIISTTSREYLANPATCFPPAANFRNLKALHIGLTTSKLKAQWGLDETPDNKTTCETLGNFFKRILPLADMLETLEIRSLEIVKIVETDQRQNAITQLQNFTRLKQLGLPTYFLAPQDRIEFVWDQNHATALPLASEDHILDIESLPSTLETLSIFPDGGAAPLLYSEGLSRILPSVLWWRARVPNLRSIRIDYRRWKAGIIHELPETALIRAGIWLEDLTTPYIM